MQKKYTRKILRPCLIPIGPSIAYVQLTQDVYCLIDSFSVGVLGHFNWSAAWKPKGRAYYALAYVEGKQSKMHRLLTAAKAGEIVDHINRNTLDNRMCNLRLVDHVKSNRNRGFSKDSVGVNFLNGKWRAQIGVAGKTVLLGNFSTFEAAANARLAAEIEHGYNN